MQYDTWGKVLLATSLIFSPKLEKVEHENKIEYLNNLVGHPIGKRDTVRV